MDSAIVLDARGRVPDLVCPGAVGCASTEGALRAGVAKVAITPNVDERDVWMAGFGRGRKAEEVHDDVWMRALVVEKGDLTVGLLVLDTVGYLHDEATRIRTAAKEAGLDLDHVVVATTHNHEGPDTMGIWGASPFESGYHAPFMQALVDDAVAVLDEASNGMRSARIVAAQAYDTEHLIHDSREPEVKDPTITALKIVDGADVFATVTIWGNHPEVLSSGNTSLTSDYPHYVRETLETRYPGSTSLFFIGTVGGLMNPLNVETPFPDRTFEKAEYIGGSVGEMAYEALESSGIEGDELAMRRHSFLFFSDNLALATAFQAGLLKRNLYGPDGAKLPRGFIERTTIVEAIEGKLAFLQSEVNALTIGPVEILTVPGELYPELWLEGDHIVSPLNADFPDAPHETPLAELMPSGRMRAIVNHGNDALGYIIPKPQFDRDEPRAYAEDGQYGEEYSLGPDTAPDLAEAVRRMYELQP